MGRILSIVAVVAVVLVGGLAAGFATGVFGVPSVTGVHNQFGDVNESTTMIETELGVHNPNPVGVSLGDVTVDYTVGMNDVPMANGTKEGVAVEEGNSTLEFATAMDNQRIPAWWYTHVRNDETTQVTVDANVSSSTLGGRSVSFEQGREIETDVLAGFDSDETRPINTSGPVPSDPALYLNSTRGEWDRENLTRERTPMDMEFEVYNPKQYPYTISRIGYTIHMNNVTVGEGETDREQVIAPRDTSTVRADTAIRNERLDEWWVSHLQRNQVTDLHIDFYLVIEVQGEEFRINPDEFEHRTTIETDVFGTKDESASTNESSTDGSGEAGDSSEESTEAGDGSTESDGDATETDTPTAGFGDGNETATPTESDDTTSTPSDGATPTPTPTEDDGGILG